MRSRWSTGSADPPDEVFVEAFLQWWEDEEGHRVGWVARSASDEAVGMANAVTFDRMPRPGTPRSHWAYVANVWVEPECRRFGVGSELIAHVIEWARTSGMERLVLNPSEMSMPMYAAAGFRPASDLMRLDLR